MKAYLCFLGLFVTFLCSATDTVFVASYYIPELVNIDEFNDQLYVRTTDELFIFDEGETRSTSIPVEKKYTWILEDAQFGSTGAYHTDYLPGEKATTKKIETILPGHYYPTLSTAEIKDRLFIAYHDQLLVYQIRKHYNLVLPGVSVRTIWCDDSIRYVGAYGGIYKGLLANSGFSDEVMPSPITYSNGEINKVLGKVYLSYDNLAVINDSSINLVKQALPEYHFRALRPYGVEIIALRARGIQRLDSNLNVLQTYLEHVPLADLEINGNEFLVGTENGLILRMDVDGRILDSARVPFELTDLYLFQDTLNVSTSGGLIRFDRELNEVYRYETPNVLQSVQIGRFLVYSTLNGLFALDNDRTVTLVPDVEFNKKALFLNGHDLYAGSVNGLYLLKRYYLEDVVLPNVYQYVLKEESSAAWRPFAFGGLFVTLLISTMFWSRRKPQNSELNTSLARFNLERIEELIKETPNIQSVSHLAEELNTSTVQLNRKFKKHDTTPGKFIQKVKGEIARELYEQGTSLAQISSRVGYSERYVKEKFLKTNSEF